MSHIKITYTRIPDEWSWSRSPIIHTLFGGDIQKGSAASDQLFGHLSNLPTYHEISKNLDVSVETCKDGLTCFYKKSELTRYGMFFADTIYPDVAVVKVEDEYILLTFEEQCGKIEAVLNQSNTLTAVGVIWELINEQAEKAIQELTKEVSYVE